MPNVHQKVGLSFKVFFSRPIHFHRCLVEDLDCHLHASKPSFPNLSKRLDQHTTQIYYISMWEHMKETTIQSQVQGNILNLHTPGDALSIRSSKETSLLWSSQVCLRASTSSVCRAKRCSCKPSSSSSLKPCFL
eukprot:m.181937 g.181937  ORF g.181937 m.181937 type:complete len:134 (-) comp16877_c0_seq2:2288-2689(-)